MVGFVTPGVHQVQVVHFITAAFAARLYMMRIDEVSLFENNTT